MLFALIVLTEVSTLFNQCIFFLEGYTFTGGGFLFIITDKSGAAKLKARRKSSIGARGSPETNSLIRFMAQQKIKSASPSQSPEVRCSTCDALNKSGTLRWLTLVWQLRWQDSDTLEM